jgi:hypothetical protein
LNLTATWTHGNDYFLSGILRAGSGQPYTPSLDNAFGFGLEDNSGRKPGYVYLDLFGQRNLRAGRSPVSVYAKVFNLFDSRFVNGPVFATTGSPYYSRFATDLPTVEDPTRYFAPRKVQAGVSISFGGADANATADHANAETAPGAQP